MLTRFAMTYTAFLKALEALGATDEERAERLKVTRRAVQAYKRLEYLPGAEQLVRAPSLFEALCKDLRVSEEFVTQPS
jgi:phosphate starvation-inducible protein PhoH